MYGISIDIFWLIASQNFGMSIKDTKLHIENLYHRIFIKNEQPDLNEKWFDIIDIYIRNREVLKK